MSSTPPAGAVPQNPDDPNTVMRKIDYLVVYGHSNLLYWWPVWLVSFVLAGVTYFEGNKMAVVPPGTEVAHDKAVAGYDGPRDVLVAPAGQKLEANDEGGRPTIPGMTVSRSNGLGVIFVATLLVVAIASTILLRGLVSLVAVVVMIAVVILFAVLGWWDAILWELGRLDIRMNAAGYLAVAVPLFVVWVLVVCVYDRAHYIVFDQGQIRYVQEVGDNEIAIQSEGAIVEKKRNDVFRHWMLGLGTGDLVIRIGGPTGPTIELENVININSKLGLIQRLVKEKSISIESS
ncbi:MAG: hypothetical protein K2X87_23965 [Gemmataceae bacterium]|nr:hypothetical protein [Gemmataceae bacterium]